MTIDRGAETWLDCILGWWLLALGWIDARHWLLPDLLTLPLVVAGLAAALAFDPSGLTDRALGAALGYLALRVVAYLYRKFRGRDGLGAATPSCWRRRGPGSAPAACRRSC